MRLLLCFAISVCCGQEPLTITSTTQLVQVVATDSKGNVVTGLRREDFQISSDRKSQPVTFFSTEGSAGDAGWEGRPTPAYALIVMDWLNTTTANRLFAQDQLVKMIKNYEPKQRVALYLLSSNARLLRDFTDDREILLDTVTAALDEPLELDDVPVNRQSAACDPRAPRPGVLEQIFFFNKKVRDSLKALGLIADRMGRLPGRKTVIWLSSGFPMEINGSVVPGAKQAEVSYQKDVEKLITRFNAADAAIYSVDARGLPAGPSRGFQDTLMEIAERTGGTAFTARNDLDVGMRLALEDLQSAYTIGFQVPDGAIAGRHDIHVTVKKAGVKLRFRESYQLGN